MLFGFGYFFLGPELFLIVANLFDCWMDRGPFVRAGSRFGGFLDSSLDRLSDMVVICWVNGLLRPRYAVSLDARIFFLAAQD